MKNLFVSLKGRLLLLAAFLLVGTLAQAQLKIGDNPTSIQKSSILELESTRQGLLLPRLADTAAINALNPPDGMMIYLNSDNSLRIRSNNSWKKVADSASANSNWSRIGNAGTNPAVNFVGTLDGQPLVMRTNNNEAVRIDANGNVGIGTSTPTEKLDVNGNARLAGNLKVNGNLSVDGTVKFDNLGAGSNELEILVIQPDGSVLKRTVSSTIFENAIKAINGIQKQALTITAGANLTKDVVEVENRSSDSTIAIHLPVQDGSSGATKPYGFLTYADWQKIQSAIQEITIGTVAKSTGDVKGASIVTNGTSREIILHAATATTSGIVSDSTQTFGGVKTFQDSLTAAKSIRVGNVGNATSTMEISGSIAMAIRTVTSGTHALNVDDNTILANATGGVVTITLPSTTGISGRLYTIKKIGGGLDNDVVINPSGTSKIDGGNKYEIYNDYTLVTLQTDGTDWYIIKK